MAVVLIVLTFDTVKVITAGHSRVPAYEVINKRIYYRMNTKRQFQEPVIGDDAPLFGKMLSPEEAEAMVSHGKMTLQARNCASCHTILGNGAYYAPDLTKAWLDPAWAGEGAREMLMVKFLMDPTTNARGYGGKRRMPNLHLTEEEAKAVVAFLKWTSAINTSGFPRNFTPIAQEGDL
jgi:nitric oxide reductase subunit C